MPVHFRRDFANSEPHTFYSHPLHYLCAPLSILALSGATTDASVVVLPLLLGFSSHWVPVQIFWLLLCKAKVKNVSNLLMNRTVSCIPQCSSLSSLTALTFHTRTGLGLCRSLGCKAVLKSAQRTECGPPSTRR